MARKPSQVINAEINRIRRVIEDPNNIDKSDQEIIQELKIKRRTYYDYKGRIRERDKAVWNKMAKESLEERAMKIMKAIDFALNINRDIAINSTDDRARIQAANQVVQNNVWAMELLQRGGKIMPKLEKLISNFD